MGQFTFDLRVGKFHPILVVLNLCYGKKSTLLNIFSIYAKLQDPEDCSQFLGTTLQLFYLLLLFFEGPQTCY